MNLFIPDSRVGWYFPAVKAGKTFLNNEKVDAIVSIGPPHTSHLVGKSFPPFLIFPTSLFSLIHGLIFHIIKILIGTNSLFLLINIWKNLYC
ncbi:MAG: hypothetical protein M5T52_21580 [Ignavibacteriaceae bacterium]|nr:hypothetical protein [Ignavibacteriaceae bacterium]